MGDNKDYSRWTKQSLVKRVKALEDELERRSQSVAEANTEEAVATPCALPRSATFGVPDWSDKPPPTKKRRREFDPSNYSTRFIALKLAYLGKNYNGFEYQTQGKMSTIEEELWKALVKGCLVFPEKPDEVNFNVCEYSKCGRTDRGVSAFGQVIALRVRSNRPRPKQTAPAVQSSAGGDESKAAGSDADPPAVVKESPQVEDEGPYPVEDELPYCQVLNRLLPSDIRILAWCPVPPPDFSARFSCRERHYRYFFTQPAFPPAVNGADPEPDPGKPKDGWLDIEAMRAAAQTFVGEHDFRNFCKIDPNKQITNFKRRIFDADIKEVADVDSALPYLQERGVRPQATAPGSFPKVYSFDVRGSAFLWHQIRHMVAVVFLVGQGLESPSLVRQLLDVEKQPRRPGYAMAEETPLVLWDCIFPAEDDVSRADALDWVYGVTPSSLAVADHLWAVWRERKMDEILANRLLTWVTDRDGSARVPGLDAWKNKSQKVFDGGDRPKLSGRYVPVLEKQLLPTPEEANEKWAKRKGFASSEEMRNAGNWRQAIKARKNGEEAMEE